MLNDKTLIFPKQINGLNRTFFIVLSAITILSVIVSTATSKMWILVIPFIALVAFLTVVDLKISFFLLFATIPFSTEVSFSNGFATDFPVEFFVIFLMFAYFAFVLQNIKTISSKFFRHPLTLLLFFTHYG